MEKIFLLNDTLHFAMLLIQNPLNKTWLVVQSEIAKK